MLRLLFNKVILIGLLIPYVSCAEGMRTELPDRKKPTSPMTIPQNIGRGDYIVGTETELTAEEWKLILNGFGNYQLELQIKNKPAYRIQFSEDPGLEKLKLELKQNPQIRYVETNSKLEKNRD